MVAVPPEVTPVTTPKASTDASVGLLLDHVPPGKGVLFRSVLLPTHTDAAPVIGEGVGLAVTITVTEHPSAV